MIGNWPLLTIITFLPMIGVLFLLMIRGDEDMVARNARHVMRQDRRIGVAQMQRAGRRWGKTGSECHAFSRI